MENNKELQFAKSLEEARQTAKQQGNCITGQQVKEIFADQSLSEEQFTLIFDYLKKHKIGVDEVVDPEEYLTDEEKNYLEEYLRELKNLPKYTAGEKEAALLSAMAGDQIGQGCVMEIYLPEVVEIAKLYIDQGVFVEDLIGEGNVALTAGVTMLGCVEAVSEAESMLIKMIMDAMEELIADTVQAHRTDKQMENKVNQVAEAARELAQALGRKVTAEELAAEGQLAEEIIEEAIRISGNAIEDIAYGNS